MWKRQGTRPLDVALKSLTKTSEEDKVKFLQEAIIMAQFRHPNVIMLYGMILNGDPVSNQLIRHYFTLWAILFQIMLVVELAKSEDLRDLIPIVYKAKVRSV